MYEQRPTPAGNRSDSGSRALNNGADSQLSPRSRGPDRTAGVGVNSGLTDHHRGPVPVCGRSRNPPPARCPDEMPPRNQAWVNASRLGCSEEHPRFTPWPTGGGWTYNTLRPHSALQGRQPLQGNATANCSLTTTNPCSSSLSRSEESDQAPTREPCSNSTVRQRQVTRKNQTLSTRAVAKQKPLPSG